MYEEKTAMVTGATSGLGHEAAAQMAEIGYGRILVSGRNQSKAEAASLALAARTGRSVFVPVALDNDRLSTVSAVVDKLTSDGEKIDTLILNAGIAPPKRLRINEDGLETVQASSLIGHHRLVAGLIDGSVLVEGGSIVIAGSEAARGDVPTMNPVDVRALAADFGSDLEMALRSYVSMEPPVTYNGPDVYASVKKFAILWAKKLSSVSDGRFTVNVVSPGSTPDTDAARDVPVYMKYLMLPLLKLIPGMSHDVSTGAERYIEIAHHPERPSGRFFASAPKKMTGPLVEIDQPDFDDEEVANAIWNVLNEVSSARFEAVEQ